MGHSGEFLSFFPLILGQTQFEKHGFSSRAVLSWVWGDMLNDFSTKPGERSERVAEEQRGTGSSMGA